MHGLEFGAVGAVTYKHAAVQRDCFYERAAATAAAVAVAGSRWYCNGSAAAVQCMPICFAAPTSGHLMPELISAQQLAPRFPLLLSKWVTFMLRHCRAVFRLCCPPGAAHKVLSPEDVLAEADESALGTEQQGSCRNRACIVSGESRNRCYRCIIY